MLSISTSLLLPSSFIAVVTSSRCLTTFDPLAGNFLIRGETQVVHKKKKWAIFFARFFFYCTAATVEEMK